MKGGFSRFLKFSTSDECQLTSVNASSERDHAWKGLLVVHLCSLKCTREFGKYAIQLRFDVQSPQFHRLTCRLSETYMIVVH